MSKKSCTTSGGTIDCPLADFGCQRELSADNFHQHLESHDHQLILCCTLRAITMKLKDMGVKVDIDDSNTEIVHSNSQTLQSLTTLAEGVSTLLEDSVQLTKYVSDLENSLIEEHCKSVELRESIDESIQLLDALQLSQNSVTTEIIELKETVSNMITSSAFDGTYIWKIVDVTEKLRLAQNDTQSSFYSPPFYSSPNGYKMCLRVYLNGDGTSRGTHMSVFFVLMRGDYDAILNWPFDYKVTFILYDQSGKQKHIVESFRPNTSSTSFSRPKYSINTASGIPRFAPISEITRPNNSYVVDDTMFLKCLVDFKTIPKACIQNIARINPGLPLDVQQQIINEEVDQNRRNTSKSGEEQPKTS